MFRNSILFTAIVLVVASTLHAEDWNRSRGPGGSGVASIESSTAASIPTQSSADANLSWKTMLPGQGVSSPIIVAGKVFVTCYFGYGLDHGAPGEIDNLMRHVVRVDLGTGAIVWQRDNNAALPEDPYSGVSVTAHGYALHTPVSDGVNVYAFLGESGVHSFDLNGTPFRQADVGNESDPTK